MEIIPVIDLRDNHAVYAVKGQRQDYQPLRTVLSDSTVPKNIVQAFIDYYAFEKIYIADLNAIIGQGDNNHVIEELIQSFPSLTFLVDQNISSVQAIRQPLMRQYVIGSESNLAADELSKIVALEPNVILSLDFRNKLFQGHASILNNTAVWPKKIIAMSLTHIASNRGPDYELIQYLQNITTGKQIYVAGGVRHKADLQVLYELGVSGVLVATALHTGKLLPDTLRKFR